MQTSTASKLAGGLLALTGVLGAVILATDQILRESLSGSHFYGLIILVIIDLAVAAYVVAKPSGMAFTLALAWSVLRIVIQIADITLAPQISMSYADFANYLFNPTLTTVPNSSGVPGALIDLIILLEVIVIGVAWSGRTSTRKTSP